MKKSKTPISKSNQIAIEKILSHVQPSPVTKQRMQDSEKIEKISMLFSQIMQTLGLDLSNDSLKKTPERIAKMYVNEVFMGLKNENFPRITVIENEMKYDQMVLVQNIEVLSVCEHHFQIIDGFATVGYIPDKKVIGLSKINRVVDYFARRPQVQERLTKQIADCLQIVLESKNVAVHISAKHYCVIARGITDSHSFTTTSDLRGDFKRKPETRAEFLRHCPSRLGS